MRISEIYLSVQGEGPRVGEHTVFVRFGGCNLKCPGWPCDSQFAIDPQYRADWINYTPEEIHQFVLTAIGELPKVNICLTGGEPFLQRNSELKTLVDLLGDTIEVGVIECFSNGTLEYPIWAHEQISFVMDWKLPASGELTDVPMRMQNLKEFTAKDAVKFTICDEVDLRIAREVYLESLEDMDIQVFYGAVWGKVTNEELIRWVQDYNLPWRFTMQIHNHIYDRNKRGI